MIYQVDRVAGTVTPGGPRRRHGPSLRRDGESLLLLGMRELVGGRPMVLVLRVREDASGVLTVRHTTPVLRIEP